MPLWYRDAPPRPASVLVPLLIVGLVLAVGAVVTIGALWWFVVREDLPGLQQPQGGIGQSVREGDLEFTVTDVETGEGEPGDDEPLGPYAIVRVTIRNAGDDPRDLDLEEQEFYDTRGWDHSHDERAASDLGESGRTRLTLNPGDREDVVFVLDTLKAGQPLAAVEFHEEEDSRGVLVPLA